VTDETPSQPVRKARVMLNANDRSIPGRTVTTDDAGRFVFSDLPDGRFTLRAEKPAHIAVNYGAKRPGRTGTPISIAANEKIRDLVMRMSRGGVITGAVRDQSGLPASGVDVYVMRYDYSPTTGARMLSWESISRTDDQGVYRAWGLPPGEYVVVANPGPDSRIPAGGRPLTGLEEIRRLSAAEVQRAIALLQAGRVGGTSASQNPPPLLPPAPPVNYAPVFHPGATNLARALSISLSAAEERTGIDVHIQLVPTATITGSCVLPSGIQPQTISVTLAYESPVEIRQGFGMPSARTSRLSPDGQFSFSGITPGRYTVLAKTLEPGGPGSARGRGGPPGPPSREASSAPSWWALAEIDVDGQNLSVPLELRPAMTIAGRLVFDGALPRPDDLSGLRAFLVPSNAGGNLAAGPPGGQVDKDGRFMFSAVTPGSYRVFWTGSSQSLAGWARKSAVALGVDVLDASLEIKAGMSTIEYVVTYSDRPTQIEGTLQDTTGRPAADYFIVVFSTDRTKWLPRSRLVQATRPATDGAYSVELPPGEYFIAALTDFETGDSNDPAFLEQLIPGAIRIAVADGEKKKQDFRIAGR
jgi:hypothetical protein